MWKDELQEKIDEIADKLNATIPTNKLQVEQDFKINLQHKLKHVQATFIVTVENMITQK